MAGEDNRDRQLMAARTVVVLAILVLVVFLYQVRSVIVLVYIALLLAGALRPIVLLLGRRLSRMAAAIIVYLVLMALIVMLLSFAGPQLAAQVRDFMVALPDLLDATVSALGVVVAWAEGLGVKIDLAAFGEQLRNELGSVLFGLLSLPVQIFQAGVAIFAVVALSFYWIVDREELLDLLFSRLGEPRRGRARAIFERCEQRLGTYVRGVLLTGLIVGLLAYVGLRLLGLPYVLVLSLIAGTLEIIPILGPVVAAIPIVMVAITQSPFLGAVALAFWFAVQQFENYLIVPIVYRTTVNLSPFVVLLSVLTGGVLLGIAGAFLAIPTAVLIAVLLEELWPADRS
ncbi:MAG: AI-2E family transporter [Chloroflexota bacterium]|nr:MAG: AI-2E family transporter [Chloroflexota bacterium]